MEIIIDKGCGLDVHKGTVVACISKLVERPEKTAIGKAWLTMFTRIGSILAMGNG